MPGDLQSTMSSSAAPASRPTSAPPPAFTQAKLTPTPTPSTSALSSPGIVQPTPTPAPMKGRSMQLGGAKKGNTIPGIDPWGNGDLMDVNADEGDWTAFESAPSTLGFDQVTTPSFAIDGSCPSSLILS